MNHNLAVNLEVTARAHGGRRAASLLDRSMSYGELNALSAQVAGWLLGRGVGPGDRVGLMLPNVLEFPVLYYGVLSAGAVVVPMNPLLKRREVAYYLADSGAELLLAWHEFAGAARDGAAESGCDCVEIGSGDIAEMLAGAGAVQEICERVPDDTAVILYTSGTTGRPKGAQLTHANLARNAEVTVRTLLDLTAEDVLLGALPLFHSFGQTCGLNASVSAGASLALIPRFGPSVVLETIERERATVFEGVPTMYAALLNHPDHDRFDVTSLRVCASGGAALPIEVLHGFERAFGCVVLEGYGLSETSPVACFNHPDRERLPGSIGTPVEGVELRVVDPDRNPLPCGEPGEIAIRGHNVMKGYLNRPEATAEAIDADGWFHTGDIGQADELGRYFIVDRKHDIIIRGGFNVYPREIEEVLYEHPAVREAAVIGLPHAELGEEIGAAVVLKPGVQATEDELRDFVRASVAAYKYPRHVWFVDELPKGPTGKVLKREIGLPADVAATADAR